MTDTRGPANGRDQAGRYEIRLEGRLDDRWAAWFDGLSLSRDTDGTTVLRGAVADQAALHGLLQKVRDIGLPLVSVICVEPDPTGARPRAASVPLGQPSSLETRPPTSRRRPT